MRSKRAYRVAFLNIIVGAHNDDADIVFLQVEGDAGDAIFKLHQLVVAHVVQTGNARDAVANFFDITDLNRFELAKLDVFDLFQNRFVDIVCHSQAPCASSTLLLTIASAPADE